MHWRFVILNKSDCYWQSAIVCLVFKVKKKARQTIYCFTLHCLVIAYYWTKNDQNVTIYSSVPHSTLLCISTDQHITTVQFYCTESTYQHLPRCTPLHRTPTIKPLYATFFTDQNCVQLYATAHSDWIPTRSLYRALTSTVPNCTSLCNALINTVSHRPAL